MATSNASDMVWKNDIIGSFSDDTQLAYEAYKEAQANTTRLREAFEQAALGELTVPTGYKVVFSYKFGRLSMGFGQGERKGRTAATGSLADWMAQQAAQGRQA